MAAISSTVANASRLAAGKLADRTTPFIRECWYVAGWSDDFGHELTGRVILNSPIAFFRKRDGTPIALADRCLHRSYPLSKSTLEGDEIICGYHGLRYNSEGECTEIPSQATCPKGLGVRSYPLVEKPPLVWIWMGDGHPDVAELPNVSDFVGEPAWPGSYDYFHLQAGYVGLHENLLDLSHLSYLHGKTFGTPDYARAPSRHESDDGRGRFSVSRDVVPTRLPPVWGEPTGLMGIDAARIARSEFLSPAAHVVHVRFWAVDLPESDRPDQQIKTAHLVTPETMTSTHYFIYHARNFAVNDAQVTVTMQEQLSAAFREDVEGLEAVERLVQMSEPNPLEISFAADKAGTAMRRYLKKRAEREASASMPTAA